MSGTIRSRRGGRATYFLACVCVALVGALALELRAAPNNFIASAISSSAPFAVADPTIDELPPIRPESAFREISARPLFSPTRRPPQAEPTESASTSPLVAELSAVAANGSDRLAVVAVGQPPRVLRLKEGDTVDGWTAVSIFSDRVQFRRGAALQEIKIKDVPPNATASHTTPAGRAPPQSAAVPAPAPAVPATTSPSQPQRRKK